MQSIKGVNIGGAISEVSHVIYAKKINRGAKRVEEYIKSTEIKKIDEE